MASKSASARMVGACALCAGVTLGNIYIGQPLFTVIAAGTGSSLTAAQGLITVSLLGYAAGLLLLVPLADRHNPRNLVRVLGTLCAITLACGALSNGLTPIMFATALAAMFSIILQILIPLVMAEMPPEQRAPAMSVILTGMICGIALSRPIFGGIGDYAGWKATYVTASIATLIVSWMASFTLPNSPKVHRHSYTELFSSMTRLVRTSPLLRQVALRNAANYAAFNAFWVGLTPLLISPPFSFSAGQASLVGLLGIGATLAAPFAGKLTARSGPGTPLTIGLIALLITIPGFLLGQENLAVVFVAAFLLPIAMLYIQIPSQHAALSIDPAAGGRLNTVFMFTTFLGGAIGSQIAGIVLQRWGWTGLCIEAAIFWLAATTLSRSPKRIS
ncbi:MFS transporter [Brucella intermedia]|uniref:MFS transporter n=1 Tax=Brucella intermedia TaxID=94625 RepID=UPI00224B9CA1|nr:MFS transporter [Brucella intermedia]